MTRQFDEAKLSAYLDGELEPSEMVTVEALMENSKDARRQLLQAVGTTARLRAAMRPVLDEPIPERLANVLASRPPADGSRHRLTAFFQLAAAVLLLVVGFGAGTMLRQTAQDQAPILAALPPGPYLPVVNETLENNLSGTSRTWAPVHGTAAVTVTPVRTYRDTSGRYFREYRLEINADHHITRISALAYRESRGNWKTKAVFF
jgi:hypothetical protein